MMNKPEGEGWMPNIGVVPDVRGVIEFRFRYGEQDKYYLDHLHEMRWTLEGWPGDILWWRIAPHGDSDV